MLRITQNSSAAGVKSYFSTSDYYSEGQELRGTWHGKGAQRLGLSGDIKQKDWDALCDNKDPTSGKTLTSRQRSPRRIGYDFTWDVPKSVSLLYGLTRDERVLDVFRNAVEATMQDMESEMQTRVRKDGRDEDRSTGNMIWGSYIHTTARPVGGVPDPHLHCHSFVFNSTWDDKEARWKAGQFAGLKRDASYFEAICHARVARGLVDLGIPIERTRRGWEIAGISASTLRAFSRRTAQIDAKALDEGILDPKEKSELGAKTRDRKRKDLSVPELQRIWDSRLNDDERSAIHALAAGIAEATAPESRHSIEEPVTRAIGHCFERNSVVPERVLVATALKGSYGTASPEQIEREIRTRPLLRAERDGQVCVTTAEVLAEERRMLDFARDGRGTCSAFVPAPAAPVRAWLNSGQQGAVRHVLTSRDRVMLIRGAAGTGKTAMMKEAVESIEKTGKRVFTFAPSADASRGVLRAEGFANADTVARLLVDPRLQADVRGQVIWIDEAGLLSTRATAQLFDLAGQLDARVILSGDRRQHGSVERGCALRLLEEEAGLVPAEIKEIQRQKGDYKQAVLSLSEGRVAEGYRELDRLGWIREVDSIDRYRTLAADYVSTVDAGKTCLVVSPTHLEGDWITAEIRSKLRKLGRVTGSEHEFETLEPVSLTEAERGDQVSYSADDVLVFHKGTAKHKRGTRLRFGDVAPPLEDAASFQVFRERQLVLAKGDRIRITRNGTTVDGKHRLNNGSLYTVRGFDRHGDVLLENGWTIAKDFGHIAYGYCVTSHASQGKTVDRVLIGQSSASFAASSREQLYVSVSRGRERATIYTDDNAELLEAVSQSADRVSAVDLMRERAATVRRVDEARLAVSRDVGTKRGQREREHG